MRKILIGLIVLGVGTAIMLSARKGLREHAGVAPEVGAVATEVVVGADPAAEAEVTGEAEQSGAVGSASEVPVPARGQNANEVAPPAAAAGAMTGQASPVVVPGSAVAARDTTPRQSAEGLQRTDRGPTHPAEAPAPLATSPQRGAPVQNSEIALVLRRAAEVYSGARSLQADFSQRSMNPILRTTVASQGTLYQRRPDRFLMRFSDPAGDLIVSDGTHFWVYYPSVDRKQVMRMPARMGAGGVDLQAQFVGDPLERFTVASEGREEVAGRNTHVLLLTPRQPLGYRALKIWVDAEDHLVRRFEVTEESGIVRHFELSNVRLNLNLSDDLFRFTPPEGTHVIDRG
jgi:outer membrane lipoprotein carrier protein